MGKRRPRPLGAWIDTVEAVRIDPARAAYWHHVHDRLSARERLVPCTHARHHGFLRRRRVLP